MRPNEGAQTWIGLSQINHLRMKPKNLGMSIVKCLCFCPLERGAPATTVLLTYDLKGFSLGCNAMRSVALNPVPLNPKPLSAPKPNA